MDKADLNDDNRTRLTLETGDESITVEISGSALPVTEFMELVELLIVNAKYDKADLDSYILQWAEDIKATKEN